MRGEHASRGGLQNVQARCRISPACAGNTRYSCDQGYRRAPSGSAPRARGTLADVCGRRQCQDPSDQPRVRGEHRAGLWISDGVSTGGSAPRARGTRRRGAGRSATPGADQPRVRGEHALRRPSCRKTPCRISPACAGNTFTGRGWRTSAWHFGSAPRARGTPHERIRSRATPGLFGSAPRARGTPSVTTRATTVVVAGSAPRARGTLHASPQPSSSSAAGSAPRARGTRRSRPRRAPIACRRISPRVRGEHPCECRSMLAYERPDQPRVRGEHWRRPRNTDYRCGVRISPACAGNTPGSSLLSRQCEVSGSAPRARGTLGG